MGSESYDRKKVVEYYNNRVEYMAVKNARHKRICSSLDRLNLKYPRTVLDLGCGTGITSIYMARQGCRVTGVDMADQLIVHAQKYNSNKNVEYIVADATELDLERKFDIIVLADVVEHIDPGKFEGLMKTINIHSHSRTLVYLNLPVALFQEFGLDKFEQQIFDNRIPLGLILSMLDVAGFIPMDIESFGLVAPIECYEIVFVTKAHAMDVFGECYKPNPESSDEDVSPDETLEGE
jgi:cyclopropane fatty-acyl-phospholipid synthase-like methyltransferase